MENLEQQRKEINEKYARKIGDIKIELKKESIHFLYFATGGMLYLLTEKACAPIYPKEWQSEIIGAIIYFTSCFAADTYNTFKAARNVQRLNRVRQFNLSHLEQKTDSEEKISGANNGAR